MALPELAEELQATARLLAKPGKGILAVGESTKTIGKRLGSINAGKQRGNRRLPTAACFSRRLVWGSLSSGAIMLEETLLRSHEDGDDDGAQD